MDRKFTEVEAVLLNMLSRAHLEISDDPDENPSSIPVSYLIAESKLPPETVRRTLCDLALLRPETIQFSSNEAQNNAVRFTPGHIIIRKEDAEILFSAQDFIEANQGPVTAEALIDHLVSNGFPRRDHVQARLDVLIKMGYFGRSR